MHNSTSASHCLSPATGRLHPGTNRETAVSQADPDLLSTTREAVPRSSSDVLQATANLLHSAASQVCSSAELFGTDGSSSLGRDKNGRGPGSSR